MGAYRVSVLSPYIYIYTAMLTKTTSFNTETLREDCFVNRSEHRYPWEVCELSRHTSDLPHCVALSTHDCSEPNRILRSELMILLCVMRGVGDFAKYLEKDISPVCICLSLVQLRLKGQLNSL